MAMIVAETEAVRLPVPRSGMCEQDCLFSRSCPFFRRGLSCPEVRVVEAECAESGVNLWDVLLGARRAS